MMTTRPPQHGHGCAGGSGSFASARLVSAASDCAAGTASSSRARTMLSARVPLANSPYWRVAGGAFGRTGGWEPGLGVPGGGVMGLLAAVPFAPQILHR